MGKKCRPASGKTTLATRCHWGKEPMQGGGRETGGAGDRLLYSCRRRAEGWERGCETLVGGGRGCDKAALARSSNWGGSSKRRPTGTGRCHGLWAPSKATTLNIILWTCSTPCLALPDKFNLETWEESISSNIKAKYLFALKYYHLYYSGESFQFGINTAISSTNRRVAIVWT